MHPITRKLNKAKNQFESGNFTEAESTAKKILRTSPANLDAINLLSVIAMQREDYAGARKLFKRAFKLCPSNALLHFNIGLACSRQDVLDDAINYLRESVRLDPSFEPAQSLLCNVACLLFHLDEAIAAGLKAVSINPGSYMAHTNLAVAYETWGDMEGAFSHFKQAVKLEPNHVQVQFNLASAYLSAGNKEKARYYLQKTLELKPDHTGSLRQLARITRYQSTDHEDFSRYLRLLHSRSLTEREKGEIHFALGKMYQDCEDYAAAFEHFNQGNDIEHTRLGFSFDDFSLKISALKSFYNAQTIDLHKVDNVTINQPLFIVGMPRSGTSLVEQVLDSHPEVFGAGERSWFWRLEATINDYIKSDEPYPECTRRLTIDHASDLRKKFIEHLRVICKGKNHTYIIDKNPGNFERLGLIWQILPNAKVIYCQREPMDNCISIYTLLFPDKIPYGYNLKTLGKYYRKQEEIMRHWTEINPGQIMSIQYEDFVNDLEAAVHELLRFLQLPWDESCLRYYENKRIVRTASDAQVRKPIYQSSIGRWKIYDKFLAPLKEALGDIHI